MNAHQTMSNEVQVAKPLLSQGLPPGTCCPTAPSGRSLASQYGLPMLRPQRAPSRAQTVEQEFMLYIMASCSAEGTDPLSFWAVIPCLD